MQGREPCFESLRTYTLNFRLFELQILSDRNQEVYIIKVFSLLRLRKYILSSLRGESD